MALTEREERALRDIECRLQRDDRALARKLRGRTRPDPAGQWLVIAPVAVGLLVAKVGDCWHITVAVALGVLLAVVAPLALSILLSIRQP